jgi:hypothetical protein
MLWPVLLPNKTTCKFIKQWQILIVTTMRKCAKLVNTFSLSFINYVIMIKKETLTRKQSMRSINNWYLLVGSNLNCCSINK